MIISELIKQLQEILEKEGDNPVYIDVDELDEFVRVQEVVGKYHSLNINNSKGERLNRAFIYGELK